MKYLLAATSLAFLLAVGAQAQMTPTCKAQATEKKLAGAAKASNVKKCVADSKG